MTQTLYAHMNNKIINKKKESAIKETNWSWGRNKEKSAGRLFFMFNFLAIL
jgi:hypothetical protein